MNKYFKQKIDDTIQEHLDVLECLNESVPNHPELKNQELAEKEMQTREFFDKYYAC